MESRSSYKYESILLNSERIELPIEIMANVSDLDIFENLNKPYLTAEMVFLDNSAVLEGVDILGGETVTIRIKSLKNDDTNIISKVFYITKIVKTIREGNNTDINIIHLTEDVAYISSLYNLNKVYTGKRYQIIQKIIKEYFPEKNFSVLNEDFNSTKVIIPNLHPIESILWLNQTSTTIEGYPFYIYRNLVEDEFIFNDLGNMLSQTSINEKAPYIHSTSAVNGIVDKSKTKIIRRFQFGITENLLEIIRKGLVGSEYQFIDTNKNLNNKFNFDVVSDLFNKLERTEVVNRKQKSFLFSEDYKINETSFNKLKNRKIIQIGGSGAFNGNNAYSEYKNAAEYKTKIIKDAMNSFVKKNPLQVIVDGEDFIDGDQSYSIGNNIDLLFQKADPDKSSTDDFIDNKRSGKYLIFACRHMFKKEKYDISLSCVKLANNDTV